MSDYTIIADGMCPSNPGFMGGSYCIRTGSKERIERLPEVSAMGTNNQAEYIAMSHALIDLCLTIQKAGRNPKDYTVACYTDSRLLVNQFTGAFACHNRELGIYLECLQAQVREFKRVQIIWHPREESVKVLGH